MFEHDEKLIDKVVIHFAIAVLGQAVADDCRKQYGAVSHFIALVTTFAISLAIEILDRRYGFFDRKTYI